MRNCSTEHMQLVIKIWHQSWKSAKLFFGIEATELGDAAFGIRIGNLSSHLAFASASTIDCAVESMNHHHRYFFKDIQTLHTISPCWPTFGVHQRHLANIAKKYPHMNLTYPWDYEIFRITGKRVYECLSYVTLRKKKSRQCTKT